MTEKISLFGNGFVGGTYSSMFDSYVMDRDAIESETSKILYFISTIHNYNVFEDVHKDVDVNLNLMLEILDRNHKKFGKELEFNFISSWFVYGKSIELPAKEDSLCDPTGFYSITKRCAEQLLISYCETFGLKYRILRLANVIGSSDKKVSKKKNALQYMVQSLMRGETVTLYKGDIVRDYIDVVDAANAMDLVLHSESTLNSITNIGNGIPLKFSDLIFYVADKVGGKVEMIDPPKFHETVQSTQMWMDNSKLQRLGYVPTYIVYQSLDRVIEDYS